MTDRHAGYVVVLADDVREDDAEAVITALRMTKGVLTVTPVVADPRQFITEARRDAAWQDALAEVADRMRRGA
jgi:hypothetical protein